MTRPTLRDLVGALAFIVLMLALFDVTTRWAWGQDGVSTIIVTTYAEGQVIQSVARTDGVCPYGGCNSDIKVEVRGQYPSIRVYRGMTSIRSTAQLQLELVPVE